MSSIIIADDHPIVLHGTQSFLQKNGHNVIAACSNGIEAYNSIVSLQPAIAILDINMPGMTGLEITEKLCHLRHRTKIILLTIHNESTVFNRAVSLSVKGYLLKEFAMDEIEKCITAVAAGDTYFSGYLNEMLTVNKPTEENTFDDLSFAERKILQLVATQKSSREIAKALFISEKTVESHRRHIIRKLNIPTGKNALLMWAMKNM